MPVIMLARNKVRNFLINGYVIEVELSLRWAQYGLNSGKMSHEPRLVAYSPGGGGGGYSRFQVTGMIEWQQKSNPSKKSLDQNLSPQKSHAEFQSHKKIKPQIHATGIHRNYHKSSDCFECPKKFVLKSSYPKKYLPKFFQPPKIQKLKILNPQKFLQSSVSLEIWSTPLGPIAVRSLLLHRLVLEHLA